jgi:uncharacterized protein with PQ loop repeat
MIHHVHKRTAKKKPKTLLDFLLYWFVFTTPLFELPQAYLIYSRRDADGVSILTWAYFAISSLVWLAYGLQQKIKPIIFAYLLYLLIEVIIVVGIITYS